MEVSIARDTPEKIMVTISTEYLALRQRVQFSAYTILRNETKRNETKRNETKRNEIR